MSDGKRAIEELRAEIARLDMQLLGTLEKRAHAARKIGEHRQGLPASLPPADRAALQALLARASGDMPEASLREIFRHVFAACVALELPLRVAYCAPEGGIAHAAARARFGATATLAPADSIPLAMEEVIRHRAEFAVVPLETRREGPVQATIAALTQNDLKIVGTLEESWNLHLLNRSGNAADVEKVYVTAADRALCARFLEALASPAGALGARVAILDVKSPLVACQIAAEDPAAAALSSDVFGAPVGLEIALKNVLDDGDHAVRYAVVGSRPSSRTGADLTSFVFSVNDAPGALLDVLKLFAERGVNLIKIHSRPADEGRAEGRDREDGAAWPYLFFVELHGHATDRALVTAFEEVKRLTRFFKVLGSYAAAA